MRVLSIQLETETGKVEDNYARAFALLQTGIGLYQPDLVLLPEGFAAYGAAVDMTPFAEPVPGPTSERFCQYSREHGVMIVFGIIRRNPQGEGHYNSAVIVDRGEIIGIYDKTHLYMDQRPEMADHNEQAIFLPGKQLGVFDTRLGRLGVLICHDGQYPEVWRCLALEGAEAIIWLLNDGDCSGWAKLHAFWNTVPVFSCNKVAVSDDGKRHGGGSIIVDVHGQPLDYAATAESFVCADIDLKEQAKYRAEGITGPSNVFRVRRVDLYGPICRPAGQ